MITPTKFQQQQDPFKQESQRRQDSLSRLAEIVLTEHNKRQAAESIQEEWDKRHNYESLQAKRDGLREQLEGLESYHRAELEHQQAYIDRLRDEGLDLDPVEVEALDRLKSEHE